MRRRRGSSGGAWQSLFVNRFQGSMQQAGISSSALVTMQADAAIEAVNGQLLGAATLEVKHADADAGRGQVRDLSHSMQR
jgi:hypothetical protein